MALALALLLSLSADGGTPAVAPSCPAGQHWSRAEGMHRIGVKEAGCCPAGLEWTFEQVVRHGDAPGFVGGDSAGCCRPGKVLRQGRCEVPTSTGWEPDPLQVRGQPGRPAAANLAIGVETGGLPLEESKAVVQKHRQQLRACYQRALARNPGVQGRLVLALEVGAGGKVTRAEVQSNTSDEPGLASCVRQAAQGIPFPAPRGKAQVLLSLAFSRG